MDHLALNNFLIKSGVKNFQAREIAPRALPDPSLWSRILPTLFLAERIRKSFLVSYIVVTSGYRDPEHNRRVGGSTNSLHLSFNALDIVPMKNASTPVDTEDVVKLIQSDPVFPFVGLGVYRTFLHIDTRGLFKLDHQGARF